MDTETTTDRDHLRELAQALGCFTEDEHLLLCGWTEKTNESKRKRGEGPPYIRHGLHYFYPRKPYAEYLHAKLRERSSAKDQL